MAASGGANEIATTPGVAGRDWVELGRVLRPHGLDGGLLVALHSADPTNLLRASEIALRGAPGTIPFAVERAERAASRVRLWLAGLADPDRARLWSGARVLVPPGALPELPEGEFYWRDLIGLEARTGTDEPLGQVAEVIATAGADLLVLRRAGLPDRLVPVVEGLILGLERDCGVLRLDGSLDCWRELEP